MKFEQPKRGGERGAAGATDLGVASSAGQRTPPRYRGTPTRSAWSSTDYDAFVGLVILVQSKSCIEVER